MPHKFIYNLQKSGLIQPILLAQSKVPPVYLSSESNWPKVYVHEPRLKFQSIPASQEIKNINPVAQTRCPNKNIHAQTDKLFIPKGLYPLISWEEFNHK